VKIGAVERNENEAKEKVEERLGSSPCISPLSLLKQTVSNSGTFCNEPPIKEIAISSSAFSVLAST
jgi:hypothetical protein